MVVRALGLIALVAVALIAARWPADASTASTTARVIVKFRPGVQAPRAAQATFGVMSVEDRPALGAQVWNVPAGTESATAAALAARPDVEYAEPDRPRYFHAVPNDPELPLQWNLLRINAPAAWDITRGAPSVRVAVIDSGFYATHPDRPRNLELGCDFGEWPRDPQGARVGSCPMTTTDPVGHGTHVTGIIGARWNNGVDIAGVAPEARIVVYKAGRADGSLASSDVADAIVAATDAGARVINLSLGGPFISEYEESAILYAVQHGVLLVTSAGNCGLGEGSCTETDMLSYPAALALDYPDNMLAIAAAAEDDTHAAYSTSADYVSMAAPGGAGGPDGTPTPTDWIWSLAPVTASERLAGEVGTSMAAPHVSAGAALVWAIRPDFTAAQVVATLLGSARQEPQALSWPNQQLGAGHLDALAALQTAVADASPTSTPTQTRTATNTPNPNAQATRTPTGTPTVTPTPQPAITPTATAMPVSVDVTSDGGTLTTNNDSVRVEVPAGAFPTTVALRYEPVPHLAAVPESGSLRLYAFELSTFPPLQPGQPVTVYITVGERDLIGLNVAGLKLLHIVDANGARETIPTTWIPQTRHLRAELTHFSSYEVVTSHRQLIPLGTGP